MPFIFLDESGDLGFNFSKKKTSKHFVVTFLFVKDEEKKPIEKIVKNVFKSFTKKEIKHHSGSLHAYKEKARTRTFVLNKLAKKNISIMSICLNKENVYTKLQDEKHILYNYVANILLDRICKKKILPIGNKIYLIASQRETNKFLNKNFKSYLEAQAKNNHGLEIEVIIKPFYTSKCLQIVDFLSWALFRHKEHGDGSYRNLIKNRIIEENDLFP